MVFAQFKVSYLASKGSAIIFVKFRGLNQLKSAIMTSQIETELLPDKLVHLKRVVDSEIKCHLNFHF